MRVTIASRTVQLPPTDTLIFLGGLGLAGSGLTHFAAPWAFDRISRPFFGADTPRWIRRNGAIESGLGAAIALKRTRVLGFAGLAGYGAFLGSRAAAALSDR